MCLWGRVFPAQARPAALLALRSAGIRKGLRPLFLLLDLLPFLPLPHVRSS